MTAALALALEAGLRLLDAARGSSPSPCGEPLRIAVLGESSAAGFSSPVSFAAVVAQGLERALPGRCITLRSYAEEGARFDGDQAEIAAAILPYFDVLLVYAGNNEVLNGVFAQGRLDVFALDGIADPRAATGPKIARILSELEQPAAPAPGMAGESRLLARTRAAFTWLATLVRTHAGNPPSEAVQRFRGVAPPPTAPHKAVAQAVVDRIAVDYLADLDRLARRAQRLGKVLVVSTVVTSDVWPPAFSSRGVDLPGSTEPFDAALRQAQAAYESGRVGAARAALDRALALDERHARANHLRGMVALAEHDHPAAWRHLEIARDEDGFPIRTLSAVNHGIRALAPHGVPAASGVRVVDPERIVRRLVERGASFDDFMNDPQHPGPRGHVLIGRAMLCALGDVLDLDHAGVRDACATPDDPHAASGDAQPQPDFALVRTRIAWLARMRRLSAHPQKFLAVAARAWRDYRSAAGAEGEDAGATLLAALGHEAADDRIDAVARVVAEHADAIGAWLRDGVTIDGPSDAPALTVLTAEDLRAVLAGEGIGIAPGAPTSDAGPPLTCGRVTCD